MSQDEYLCVEGLGRYSASPDLHMDKQRCRFQPAISNDCRKSLPLDCALTEHMESANSRPQARSSASRQTFEHKWLVLVYFLIQDPLLGGCAEKAFVDSRTAG